MEYLYQQSRTHLLGSPNDPSELATSQIDNNDFIPHYWEGISIFGGNKIIDGDLLAPLAQLDLFYLLLLMEE